MKATATTSPFSSNSSLILLDEKIQLLKGGREMVRHTVPSEKDGKNAVN